MRVLVTSTDTWDFPELVYTKIEESYWDYDEPGDFSKFHCLYTLELTCISLHEVRNLPSSLERFRGLVFMYRLTEPLTLDNITCQVPNLRDFAITGTDVPIAFLLPLRLEKLFLTCDEHLHSMSTQDKCSN